MSTSFVAPIGISAPPLVLLDRWLTVGDSTTTGSRSCRRLELSVSLFQHTRMILTESFYEIAIQVLVGRLLAVDEAVRSIVIETEEAVDIAGLEAPFNFEVVRRVATMVGLRFGLEISRWGDRRSDDLRDDQWS